MKEEVTGVEEKRNDTSMVQIPYFVHEGIIERWWRIFKFMLIALIVTIILLFASNAMWAYYWYQFDVETEEITLEADDGDANYIGHNGDISYGETES